MFDMVAILRVNVEMKSSENGASMSIGQVAARFGLPTHALRHWESWNCCHPPGSLATVAATRPVTCTGWR